jgi:hypothetical protein
MILLKGIAMRALTALVLFSTCYIRPVSVSAQEASDGLALHRLLGEDTLSSNALEICKQASRLPAAERFEFLARWVLPNDEHRTFRLVGDYHSTNPAPPVNFQTTQGTQDDPTSPVIQYLKGKEALAIPAMELIDTARTSRRLNELRDRVLACDSPDLEQRRSELALLFLIEVASKDYPEAEQIFEQFIPLDHDVDRKEITARWRDLLVMWMSYPDDRARRIVGDYFMTLYADLGTYYPDRRYDLITDYLRVLHGIYQYLESEDGEDTVISESLGGTAEFIPFGFTSAFNSGHGRPTAMWVLNRDGAYKLAGHELDYLAYRIPLRGQYAIEADLTTGSMTNSTFMVAGKRVEYVSYNRSLKMGSFRFGGESLETTPPLITVQEWVRHRTTVGNGLRSHFINGREFLQEPITPHYEPWVAIANWRRSHGGIRNLRILGEPEIPDALHLTGDPNLAGWVPYYESGFGANQGFWSDVQEAAGGYGLSGYYRDDMAGTGMEELIRYIRPMVEGGTVEYDFFYQEGKSGVHPAIDRLAFLLRPDGARIHWISDGKYDRSGLDPWNATLERENQRGPETLPLIENDWNHVTLELEQDIARLSLNGQLIYERKLEPENRRIFGLFHYCGETEAHARNVVWRGNWPKELAPPADRELAKPVTQELDAGRDELPAVFRHDFSEGLPPELFDVAGDETFLEVVDRGILVRRKEDTGVHAIRPCLQLAGDFDIVLAFEDLEIVLPVFLERTGIGLAATMHNLTQDEARLFRRNGRSSADQRAEFEHILLLPNGKFHYNGGRHMGEAANSGRLRLARRGQTFYALVSEFDSPDYRIIEQRTVSDDDVAPQGIQLLTDCARYLRVSAVFTKLEIRAERIYGLPVENPQPIVQSLDEQRKKLHERRIDFTKPESYQGQLLPLGQISHEEESTDRGLRWKVSSDGGTHRVQYLVRPTPSPILDVETGLSIAQLDTPPVMGQHSEVVLETLFIPDEENLLNPIEAALILRQKANGVRSLVARVYRARPGGGMTYLPIRSVPVNSPDRLRIAVHDKTIYFLYSESKSDELKVLAEYHAETAPSIRTVMLNVRTNGEGRTTDVTWKSLSLFERESEQND